MSEDPSVSELVYYYDPTPEADRTPWWMALNEGDILPMYDTEGVRIGTATVGKRIPASEPMAFEVSFDVEQQDRRST